MEYYLALNKNEVTKLSEKWLDLECVLRRSHNIRKKKHIHNLANNTGICINTWMWVEYNMWVREHGRLSSRVWWGRMELG